MPRRFRRVVICLILGVTTSVVVAWGAAGWHAYATKSDSGEWFRTKPFPAGQVRTVTKHDSWGAETYRGSCVNITSAMVNWISSPYSQDMWAPPSWIRPFPTFETFDAADIPDDVPYVSTQIGAGWPAACMAGMRNQSSRDRNSTQINNLAVKQTGTVLLVVVADKDGRDWTYGSATTAILPLRPIWFGFALNTVLYGVAWWMLLMMPRVIVEYRRLRRGACAQCGYDRRRVQGPCPECGASAPGETAGATIPA